MTHATKPHVSEVRQQKRHPPTLREARPHKRHLLLASQSPENLAHACERQTAVLSWTAYLGSTKGAPRSVADELSEVKARLLLLEEQVGALASTRLAHTTPRIALLFAKLREEWRAGTRTEASLVTILMHPAYQRIIGLGMVVVPLIMEELSSELDHWHWALAAVTGEDPVPEDAAGDLEAIAAAWLSWWKVKAVV